MRSAARAAQTVVSQINRLSSQKFIFTINNKNFCLISGFSRWNNNSLTIDLQLRLSKVVIKLLQVKMYCNRNCKQFTFRKNLSKSQLNHIPNKTLTYWIQVIITQGLIEPHCEVLLDLLVSEGTSPGTGTAKPKREIRMMNLMYALSFSISS